MLADAVLEVVVPPGDKADFEWWLYDPDQREAYVAADNNARLAFALVDQAKLERDTDQGGMALALSRYEQAVSLVPKYCRTWLRMCLLLQKLERYPEARAACEKAASLTVIPDVERAANKLLKELP